MTLENELKEAAEKVGVEIEHLVHFVKQELKNLVQYASDNGDAAKQAVMAAVPAPIEAAASVDAPVVVPADAPAAEVAPEVAPVAPVA